MKGHINSDQFDQAANDFVMYNRAEVGGKSMPIPGLTKRRENEAKLFRYGEH